MPRRPSRARAVRECCCKKLQPRRRSDRRSTFARHAVSMARTPDTGLAQSGVRAMLTACRANVLLLSERRRGWSFLQQHSRTARARLGLLGMLMLLGSVALGLLYYSSILQVVFPGRPQVSPPLMQQPPAALPMAQDVRHRPAPPT